VYFLIDPRGNTSNSATIISGFNNEFIIWKLNKRTKSEGKEICNRRTEEVVEDWIRLHDEELNNLYASPNIIRMIKSRRVR